MAPKKPVVLKTEKTAAGAQQYVRGATRAEKRDTVFKAINANNAGNTKKRLAIDAGLNAAASANESKNIAGIVGRKAAKTDRTVKMYDKFESQDAARLKKYAKKP